MVSVAIYHVGCPNLDKWRKKNKTDALPIFKETIDGTITCTVAACEACLTKIGAFYNV